MPRAMTPEEVDRRLRRSEERYRNIVQIASEGIVVTDPALHIRFVNGRTKVLTGRSNHELIGRRLDEIVAPRTRDVVAGTLSGLTAGEERAEVELQLERPDAEPCWVLLSATLLPEDGEAEAGLLAMLTDITARKRADEKVRFQADLLEAVGEAIVATRHDGTIVYWNRGAERLYGWSAAEVMGRSVVDVTPAVEARRDGAELMMALDRGQSRAGELRVGRKDGTTFPAYVSNSPIRDDNGLVVGVIGVSFDVSDRDRAERAARRRGAQQAAVATVGELAIQGRPLDDVFARAAQAAARALDADLCELLLPTAPGSDDLLLRAGHGFRPDLVGKLVLRSERGSLAAHSLRRDAPVVIEDLTVQHPFEVPIFLREHGAVGALTAVLRIRGRPSGVLGVFTKQRRRFDPDDVNFLQSLANVLTHAIERRLAEHELRSMAVTDELTGIPNRTLFLDRLEQALARSQRGDALIGVLFVDLDRFKVVNDALGHGAGDQVLRHVAGAIGQAIRPSDTVARLGGDEFVVLCEGVVDATEVVRIGERIKTRLDAEPLTIETRAVHPRASIGVAVAAGRDGAKATDVLADADAAMYEAKQRGGSHIELFDRGMRSDVLADLDLANEFRRALEHGELVAHFQPEVDLATGRTVWVEALMRWNHPERGMLTPAHFLRVAEDTGLVVPAGEVILDQALAQMARWRTSAWAPSTVAVNVSARQLVESDLVGITSAALDRHRLPPEALWLELTENTVLREHDRSLGVLEQLKKLGVGLAIDDFGTGFSSLEYASRFPVDALKIDRSFVGALDRRGGAGLREPGIVRAVIEIAQSFGLLAIAEGAETEQQLRELRALDCDFAQGYALTKALPAADVCPWVRRHRRRVG